MKNLIILILSLVSIMASAKEITVIKSNFIYGPDKGFLKEKYILIKDGLIIDLKEKYIVQKKDEFFDFSQKVILPGFIDSHTHLFLTDDTFDGDFPGALKNSLKNSQTKRYELAKARAKVMLVNGFTSVRDLGNSGRYLDKKLANETLNNNEYPRIFISGPGICIIKCQFSQTSTDKQVRKEYDLISDFSMAKKLIDIHKQNNVDFLKVYIDNIPSEGQMSESLFSKIIEYANKSKLKIVVHAIEKETIELAAKYPIHSIEHANIITKKAMNLILENKIIIVPTDLGHSAQRKVIHANGQKNNEAAEMNYITRKRGDRVRMIEKYKAKLAFGSDFYFPVSNLEIDYPAAIFESLKNLKVFGLENSRIIYVLTKGGAMALNMSDKLGDIKVGYYADFVILNKNPVKSIENLKSINRVFKNGEIIKVR